MKNLKTVYSALYNSFKVNKIAEPKISTLTILNRALQKPPKTIQKLPPTPISLYHYNKIKKLALRRLKHEPIEYIARNYNFNGIPFDIIKPVVVPNPSSKEVLDTALKLLEKKEEPIHFLDANCSCGIFSVSLLKMKPKAIGVAIDPCLEDLEITAKNFHKILGKPAGPDNNLELIQTDFAKYAKKSIHKFDLIIASPPSFSSEEWENLEKETKLYENRKSLDGGLYGLDKIWEVLRTAADLLKKDGFLIIEMKDGQPEYLEKYFAENGGVAHNLKIHTVEQGPTIKARFMTFKKDTSKKNVVRTEKQNLEQAL